MKIEDKDNGGEESKSVVTPTAKAVMDTTPSKAETATFTKD